MQNLSEVLDQRIEDLNVLPLGGMLVAIEIVSND